MKGERSFEAIGLEERIDPFNFPRQFSSIIWILFLSFLLWRIMSTPGPMALAQGIEKPKASVDFSTAFIQVARQTIPAVAHIEVIERKEVGNPYLLFENARLEGSGLPRKHKLELRELGTGMIIDPQGNILTNFHVAGGATKVRVTLADGNRYPAELVGGDPKTDLAVIHISATENLPNVTFGDSDKVEVGEWVVAIGHPRGLDQSVTHGIISAKHRRGIIELSRYQDLLQTDAAANPGNSGGPLLNLQGEVIGVNAMISPEFGGFEGISFAIPSNIAVYVSKALIAHRKVERGWLGLNIQDVMVESAQSNRPETPKGAVITGVFKGGPAEKAGFKKGDIVIHYQGKEILDAGSLQTQVSITPIGQEAPMIVKRDGREQEITAKVGNLEDAPKVLASSIKDRLGISVRPITSKEIRQYELISQEGVAIATLEPKGPFGEAGFNVGDIILVIDGQSINNPEDFVFFLSGLKTPQEVSMLALDHRNGAIHSMEVKVP